MIKQHLIAILMIITIAGLSSCDNNTNKEEAQTPTAPKYQLKDSSYYFDFYAEVELKADISRLTDNQKEVLRYMLQAAKIMDDIFWKEAYGDKEEFLSRIDNQKLKRFATINYGPWDRLNANKPYLNGIEKKPDGANFYPHDMTKKEFEALKDPNKTNLYTIIKRDTTGNLKVVWYHEAFKEEINQAAELLIKASEYADNEGLKNYLALRAAALLTDKYQISDLAWMDMKTSDIDFVVGPIENYEDHMFGYKAAHESFILIKDKEWSDRLAKFSKFLPQMQRELPVEEKYKKETPGSDVDLNAYDVIFYAGDCNAGSKTIAINLPNDPEVQLNKGSRKLQLKNAMRAKFDKILVPISNVLIAEDQRQFISFDAFFANTMFHEVAHGMGVKKVITDPKISCRVALKDQFSALEEGKADILGLYLVTKLNKMGELTNDLRENYITFMASIFRSIRFGASSAHGKANMIRFNYFLELGAFTRNEDGTYSVNLEKMKEASTALTQAILKIQGDGNYEVAKAFVDKYSVVGEQLRNDLARLDAQNIPKDIYYKQGAEVLGL